jgi:uncharacterized protein YecA (UPF0149 family)
MFSNQSMNKKTGTIGVSMTKSIFTLPFLRPHKLPIVSGEKIDRNAPCPCGSNKKYKKCCINL